jgi:hypothetical protein
MMTLVEEGKDYRIFFAKQFGIVPYYLVEDKRKATVRNGATYGVNITKHYCKSLAKAKRVLE